MRLVTLTCVLLAALVASLHAADATPAEKDKKAKVNKPADRVVVMYFHRTKRCPTCLRMGSYTEEAVLKGFAKDIKKGTVEFCFVDFQDKKNAKIAKAYGIGGPTLIVAKVVDNKVVAARNLTDIWTKNRDKDVFLKYVRDNVVASQKPIQKTARRPQGDPSAT
jgi:hypothetical protein